MKIPSKNRPEWQALLTGQINVPLKNFFFQMKITQAKNQIAKNKISLEEAIDELYELCVKFSKAKYMDIDIQNIFYSDNSSSQHLDETSKDEKFDEVVKQSEQAPAKIESKSEKLERIRLQEQQAKSQKKPVEESLQTQLNPSNEESDLNNSQIDRIKIEAQRAIQRRYELELKKRNNKIEKENILEQISENQGAVSDGTDDTQDNVTKEKTKLRNNKKRKEKKKVKRVSFFKRIFGNA